MHCYVNKAHAKFLFTLFQYNGKSSFYTDLSIGKFVLKINKQFLAFVVFKLCIDLKYSCQHSKCK